MARVYDLRAHVYDLSRVFDLRARVYDPSRVHDLSRVYDLRGISPLSAGILGALAAY